MLQCFGHFAGGEQVNPEILLKGWVSSLCLLRLPREGEQSVEMVLLFLLAFPDL